MFRRISKVGLYLFYFLIASVVIVFSISNRQTISLDLFPFPFTLDTPLFFFGFVSFSLGVLLAGLYFSMKNMRHSLRYKKESKRKQALENEVASLRAEALSLTHVNELTKKAS